VGRIDRELKFIVSLKDNASRQARALANNLNQFNGTYRATISMNLVDNVTKKLRGIFSTLGGERGASNLFTNVPPGYENKIRKLGKTISSIFKGDESKSWYEKIFGYLGSIEKMALRIGDALVGAFAIGGGALMVGLGIGASILSKQIIKINSEMEQFEVSLQTTLGSLTAAKKEMAGIVIFAKETPYQIKEVTAAVVKLRAYAMDSKTWLEPLGNAASAFGRDITDAVEMAADAVQGMFRRALSYGIRMDRDMFKEGGKYAGMTYADALMRELQKRFVGGMELQSKTLKGIWSNIKDTLYIQFQQASKPIYGIIKNMVKSVYDFLGSDAGQAKLRKFFDIFVESLYRIIEVAKNVYNYFNTNLVPIAKTVGTAMIETFMTVTAMVKPILTALLPLVTAFSSILVIFSKLITASKLGLIIFISFSAAVKVMKLLGFTVSSIATKMVATNRAATLLSATVSTLGVTMAIAGAAFAAAWAIGNFLEVRNNLKAIGEEMPGVAKGAENVKNYIKEIGEESGHSFKEITKMAVAAKEFGANMSNVLEQAALATGKAKEGYGANLIVSVEQAVEVIGRLAEAMIKEGDTIEIMKEKTASAADFLVNLNRVSGETGISFDNLSIAIENNRTTLENYADNLSELNMLIVEFSKAAKGLDIEANVGQLFESLDMLYSPSKEMLLSLPVETWIAKSIDQLDKDVLASFNDILSTSLDMTEVKKFFLDSKGVQSDMLNYSGIIKNNQLEGAKAQILASEKMIEAAKESGLMYDKMRQSTGTGKSPVKGKGFWDKLSDFSTTKKGLATEAGGGLATLYIGVKTWNATSRRIEKKVSTMADNNFFKKGLIKFDEKRFTKSLGRDFGKRIDMATKMQTKNLAKEWTKNIADLEKELKNVRQTLDEGLLSQLKKAGFSKVSQAVPTGMSAEEFMQKFPEEAFNNLSKKQKEIFDIWEKSFRDKIVELENGIATARKKGLQALRDMIESHKELAKTFKNGRVPASMRKLADEIKVMTDTSKTASSVFKKGLFGRGATKAASTAESATAAERIHPIRRGLGTAFLSLFDKRGYEMSIAFLKGLSLRNVRQTFIGWGRVLGDVIATSSEKAMKTRVFSLTVGPYIARLQGKLRNATTGRFGGQSGEIGLEGLGKLGDLGKKLSDMFNTRSKSVITEIKTISPDLAKSMGTQFENGKYFVQPHVLEQKLAEIAETGKITKPIIASIDRMTGELVMLDGHTSVLAAEMKGLKELSVTIDTGNWQELIGSIKSTLGKTFPNITDATLSPEGKLTSKLLDEFISQRKTNYVMLRKSMSKLEATEKTVGSIRDGVFHTRITEGVIPDEFLNKVDTLFGKIPKELTATIKYALVKTVDAAPFGGYVGPIDPFSGGIKLVINKATNDLIRVIEHETAHMVGISDKVLNKLDFKGLELAEKLQTKELKKSADILRRYGKNSSKSLDYLKYLDSRTGIDAKNYAEGIKPFIKENATWFSKMLKQGVSLERAVIEISSTDVEDVLSKFTKRAYPIVGNAANGTTFTDRAMDVITKSLTDNAKKLKLLSAADIKLAKSIKDGTDIAERLRKSLEQTTKSVDAMPDKIARAISAGRGPEKTFGQVFWKMLVNLDRRSQIGAGSTKGAITAGTKVIDSLELILRGTTTVIKRGGEEVARVAKTANNEIVVLGKNSNEIIARLSEKSFREIPNAGDIVKRASTSVAAKGGELTTRATQYIPFSYEIISDSVAKATTKATTSFLTKFANVAAWSSLPDAIDELVLAVSGKSIEQVPVAGTRIKGALSTVGGAVGAAFGPVSGFGTAIGTQISDAINGNLDAYEFTNDTGIKGWLKDLSGNANKLGKAIVLGVKDGFMGGITHMNEGINKLVTGKAIGSDSFNLTEQIWGKQAAET
jgi:hypothetical protein